MVTSRMRVRSRMVVILARTVRKKRVRRRAAVAAGPARRHVPVPRRRQKNAPRCVAPGSRSDRARGAGYLLARFAALAAFFSFFEEAGAFLPSRWVCFSLTMGCSLSLAGCWSCREGVALGNGSIMRPPAMPRRRPPAAGPSLVAHCPARRAFRLALLRRHPEMPL